MMPDTNFVLEQLDWHTVTCQCEIEQDCAHPATQCPNPATRQIEFHAVDHCNTEDLTPFGNYVFLLCLPCFGVLAHNVDQHLQHLTRYGRPHCLTCGAPVCQLNHVIREVTEL